MSEGPVLDRLWNDTLQQAAGAMALHDGTNWLRCNDAFAASCGAKPAELEGTPLSGVLHDADGATSGGQNTLRSAKDDLDIHIQSRSVAPDVWFIEVQGGQGRKEDELRRLQETSAFKTQILNTTAHELNTPLTPVRLQLHLLKTGALGVLSERHGKAVAIVDRNVERLSYLVNDILDVARLESGRIEMNRRPVALTEILVDGLESFEETARRVGVGLSMEGPDDLVLDADPERIMQILYNLVGNALKFTPEGGRVIVRTQARDDFAVIRIEDNGPGLTPEQIAGLFQPFSRVHDTQHSTIAGTGLGLFICKGIVESHGGTISAESGGAGRGATFQFTIPLSPISIDPPVPTQKRTPKPIDPLARRLRELI